MSIAPGEDINAADFINRSEANATPSNDAGRVPRLEADGRLDGHFTKNGFRPNAGETINGATLPVPVFQNKSDNEVYACDANDATKYKFIGFAISNSTNGNPINVQTHGIVHGFTGLAEGEKYYVQDTAGTIGTSPGTHAILVGVAVSETALMIQKGMHRAIGIANFTDAGNDGHNQDTAITLGFRPSVIRAHATSATESSLAGGHSCGVWLNGSYAHVGLNFSGSDTDSLDGTSVLLHIRQGDGSPTLWEVTIINVTDTGFTLRVTQRTDNPGQTLEIVWEAEGEL